MSFVPSVNLFVNLSDFTRGPLVVSESDPTAAVSPIFCQADKFYLRLWFLERTGNIASPFTNVDLGAGYDIAFGAKKKGSLSGGFLFSVIGGFTKVIDGSDVYYQAEIDLNTSNLSSALGSDDSLTAVIDIEIQNSGNTQRVTIPQFEATVKKQVVTGTEGVPTEGDPVYPAPAAIAIKLPASANYRIHETVDGVFIQIKNRTSGKWHTLAVENVDGAPVLALGLPED